MKHDPGRQGGGSFLGTLVILALIAYGAYVALQYIPQWIEARSIQTILDSMRTTQGADPVNSVQGARDKVIRMLQINEMNDMTESFDVARAGDYIVVTFSYDRELNLVYKQKTMHYEQSVSL